MCLQRAGEHSTLRAAAQCGVPEGSEEGRGECLVREEGETGALRVRSLLLLILHCPVDLKDLLVSRASTPVSSLRISHYFAHPRLPYVLETL